MRAVFAAVSIIALVGGCAVSEAHYKQTWTTSYAQTTCLQWTNEMTDKQREAASYDLIRERLRARGSNDRPGYNRVLDFRSVLTDECAKRSTQSMTKAASRIYFAD